MESMTNRIDQIAIEFTAGTNLLCKMIRANDRASWEGAMIPSAINHVLIHFTFTSETPSWIYESHKAGVYPSPYSHLLDAFQDGRVLRIFSKTLDLKPEQKAEIWKRAKATHGKAYDNRLILLYLIWNRVMKKGPAKRLFRLDNPRRFTCNEFATLCLAGIHPLVPADAGKDLTPEGLFVRFHGRPSKIVVDEHPGTRLFLS